MLMKGQIKWKDKALGDMKGTELEITSNYCRADVWIKPMFMLTYDITKHGRDRANIVFLKILTVQLNADPETVLCTFWISSGLSVVMFKICCASCRLIPVMLEAAADCWAEWFLACAAAWLAVGQ